MVNTYFVLLICYMMCYFQIDNYLIRLIHLYHSIFNFTIVPMEHLLKVRKSSLIEQPVQRIIIGVAGGSAAGKTTLCENIHRQMAFDRNFKVEMVSLDSFYKSLDTSVTNVAQYNFDHPNALDFDLAYDTLRMMKQTNEKVPIPQYSFVEHKRLDDPTYAHPANIILFEGLMAFHDPRIRDLMTYKVFIICDDDIRLCRRIKRDTTQRGRTIENVLRQYNKFVKDSFRNFIQPTMVHADIIIPGFRNNRVSVDFIVQHIKHIARRINYRETASRTKIYIIGENQLYDFEYREQYNISLFQQCFLVFPTAEEHKKELQFFMNRLISETFSHQYYEQIYICQFVKIQKSLLNQLINLKEFKLKQIQIFTEQNIEQIDKYNLYSKKVKVIFFPVAYSHNTDRMLHLLKKQKDKKSATDVYVILTIFCDINFPRIIYKLGLPNIILINLFIISNQRKFRKTMENNIISKQKKQDWLHNDQLLANQAAYVIANDLKLTYISDLTLERTKYELSVTKMVKPLKHFTINQKQEIIQPFYQKNVYSQQHENLCGYHTLINIILLDKKEQLGSKQKFLKYYHILSKEVQNFTYDVLERNHVEALLQTNQYFHGLNISVIYYSMNYIQNTVEQLAQIEKTFWAFRAQQINSFYLIMGVYDHFLLAHFVRNQQNRKESINIYDSSNISLRDIMNGTHNQFTLNNTPKDQFDQNHMRNMKQALQILLMVFKKEKTFKQILLEKRIEEIAVPFLQLKDQQQMQQFFKHEYPIPVIVNDLLKPLKKIGEKCLSQKHQTILSDWRKHPAIKWGVIASLSQ